MADLKISQLTETTSAASGDYFIINKGDATTQKIDFSALSTGATAGVEPIYLNFYGNGGTVIFLRAGISVGGLPATGTNRFVGEVNTGQVDSNGNFITAYEEFVVGNQLDNAQDYPLSYTKQTVNVKFPAGANRALLIYNFNNRLVHNISKPADTIVDATVTNLIKGTPRSGEFKFVTRRGESDIAKRAVFGRYTDAIWNSGDTKNKFGQDMSNLLIVGCKFDPGAEVDFQISSNINRCKRGSLMVNPGRGVLLPYNESDTNVASMLSSLGLSGFSNDDDDGDIEPLTQEELATNEGSYLRHQIAYLTSVIQSTLDYGGITDATDIGILQDALRELIQLKGTASIAGDIFASSQVVEDEIDRIVFENPDVLRLCNFTFQFERDAGVSRANQVF